MKKAKTQTTTTSSHFNDHFDICETEVSLFGVTDDHEDGHSSTNLDKSMVDESLEPKIKSKLEDLIEASIVDQQSMDFNIEFKDDLMS
jgi:hypothetical protein